MAEVLAPISFGELLDKITILEIKTLRIADADKRINVQNELDALIRIWQQYAKQYEERIAHARSELKAVNARLWDIEDAIRLKERDKAFDAEFIALARSVYLENDTRARWKREINTTLPSRFIEEKSYAEYR